MENTEENNAEAINETLNNITTPDSLRNTTNQRVAERSRTVQISQEYMIENETVGLPSSMKAKRLDLLESNSSIEIRHNPETFYTKFLKSLPTLFFVTLMNIVAWSLTLTFYPEWVSLFILPFIFSGASAVVSYIDQLINIDYITISPDSILIEKRPLSSKKKKIVSNIRNLTWDRNISTNEMFISNEMRYKVEAILRNGSRHLVMKFNRKKEAMFIVQEFHRIRSHTPPSPIVERTITTEMKRDISEAYLQENPVVAAPPDIKVEVLDANTIEVEILESQTKRRTELFCYGIITIGVIVGCVFGLISAFSDRTNINWRLALFLTLTTTFIMYCILPEAFDSTFCKISSDLISVERRPIGKKCFDSSKVTDIKDVFFLTRRRHLRDSETRNINFSQIYCIDVEKIDQEELTILYCRTEEEAKFIIHEFHRLRFHSISSNGNSL